MFYNISKKDLPTSLNKAGRPINKGLPAREVLVEGLPLTSLRPHVMSFFYKGTFHFDGWSENFADKGLSFYYF